MSTTRTVKTRVGAIDGCEFSAKAEIYTHSSRSVEVSLLIRHPTGPTRELRITVGASEYTTGHWTSPNLFFPTGGDQISDAHWPTVRGAIDQAFALYDEAFPAAPLPASEAP